MSQAIDTDEIRASIQDWQPMPPDVRTVIRPLLDEIDRLRADVERLTNPLHVIDVAPDGSTTQRQSTPEAEAMIASLRAEVAEMRAIVEAVNNGAARHRPIRDAARRFLDARKARTAT